MEKEIPILLVTPTEATYLIWINYKKLNISEEIFIKALGERLIVSEGSKFGENGHGYIRLNIACSFDVLKKAMPILKDVVLALALPEKKRGYNWLEHWKKNEIDFHQISGNPFLKLYWPKLKLSQKAEVFVPLCGKSFDLLWLATQGWHVTGIELSEIACEAFFKEHKLTFTL